MGTNCAPLLADIFLYSYEAEFIQSLLSASRKQLASRFNFTSRYIHFENYLGQLYPVELENKDTTESNPSYSYLGLLLLIGRDGHLHTCTSFYDKRDDFNVHITILLSWVEIYQLRPPMASLSHSWYDMPGHVPRMDVLFWGRYDFQIRFSNRDTSRNAWNRYYRSFMVDTGSYKTIRSSSLTNAKLHSVAWPNTMTALHRSGFIPIRDLLPNSTLHWLMRGFNRTFATCEACWQETLTPPDTWSYLGLVYVILFETNFFPNLSLFFWTMLFEYPSVLSRFCFFIFEA